MTREWFLKIVVDNIVCIVDLSYPKMMFVLFEMVVDWWRFLLFPSKYFEVIFRLQVIEEGGIKKPFFGDRSVTQVSKKVLRFLYLIRFEERWKDDLFRKAVFEYVVMITHLDVPQQTDHFLPTTERA